MRTLPTIVLALLLLPAAFAQHVHTPRKNARLLPLPKEKDVWHFLIYGDRTGGPSEGIAVLSQAVDEVNLIEPDLVMTVGDLIQGYNRTPQWLVQMADQHHAVDSGFLKNDSAVTVD